MERPTYRVAVIGTGGIAAYHADYYVAHPRTVLVAAADIRPQALTAFCDRYDVARRYEDYRELLATEKPDLVSICTWTGTHPEIAIAAAEAGVKGILCEKPMSAHLGDARQAVAVCTERGVPMVIHHQRRYSPEIVAARRRIAAGDIGRPVMGTFRSTGGFLNNGSHGVDLHRYLMGDPATEWVMACLERRTNRYERGVLVEDRIAAAIRFEGGYELIVETDVEEKPEAGWWVFGTEGALSIGWDQVVLQRGGSGEPLVGDPSLNPLEELVAWVEGGPESRTAGRIALATHETMMAAYQSARLRAKVTLPLGPEVERSPLYTMSDEGALPVSGERYDIRSVDALRYALEREGIPLTGGEHLEGEGAWSGQGPAGTSVA